MAPRRRLTLARIMLNIALAAVFFAAARQNHLLGAIVASYVLWISLLVALIRGRSKDGRIF